MSKIPRIDDDQNGEPRVPLAFIASTTRMTSPSLDTLQATSNTTLVHMVNLEGKVNQMGRELAEIKSILTTLKCTKKATTSDNNPGKCLHSRLVLNK